MCQMEEVTLEHFILWCPALNNERNKYLILQKPYIETYENIIARLLCFDVATVEEISSNKNILCKLWSFRTNYINNIQR